MPFHLPHSLLLMAALLVGSAGLRSAESPDYETEIRPILKEHCTHCHGEEEKPKGGVDLRLRRFMDGKTEDGDPVLTPGDPEKSALWTLTRDGEMPKKGKKMPEHQLALLAAWGVARLAWARLGGLNGDALGAMIALGEVVLLLAQALLGPAPSSRAGPGLP